VIAPHRGLVLSISLSILAGFNLRLEALPGTGPPSYGEIEEALAKAKSTRNLECAAAVFALPGFNHLLLQPAPASEKAKLWALVQRLDELAATSQPDKHVALCKAVIGQFDVATGRLEQAESHYKESIAIFPSIPANGARARGPAEWDGHPVYDKGAARCKIALGLLYCK
jgi:hypothetical protein